jgi:glyoxylase-like metal-dependent hydrolase (beta-lactamase superfamily II)
MAISRRTFVFTSAAAAFGLDGRLTIEAASLRKQTPDPAKGYYRYKIGAAECTALYDGIWEKVHDAKYFGNATLEDTKKALAAAGQTTAFVPIPITMLVVKLAGKLVLCDAGGGGQVQAFNPRSLYVSGKMITNMRAAGIDPKKIETILISHFHPDHIFGLLNKENNAPVFPNAEIIVPAAEYKFWTDPSLPGRLPADRVKLARRIQAVIPNWKNVLPVEGEDEVVPGIRFLKAPGHTPGHTVFHLSSGREELIISNDAIYVPALLAAHPGWRGSFDQDGQLAEQSRRKLLDRAVTDKTWICGAHFPWPGVGRMHRDGNGYVLTPAKV